MQKARTKAGHHITPHPPGPPADRLPTCASGSHAQPGAKITRAPGLAQHGQVPGVSARTTPPYPVPGKAAIYAAVPGGSRRARSQRAYLAALLADPELAGLRADARRSVLEVARVLARWASWRTMTAWRPRARIRAEVGSSRDPARPLSVSAYKRARQWLEGHGYLGLVEPAFSPMFSPGVLAGQAGPNRSPVFVLTTPRRRCQIRKPAGDQSLNGPLSRARSARDPVHARAKPSKVKTEMDPAARGRPVLPPGGPAPHHCPRTRGEALSAARVIQDRARDLRRISAEHVRSIARVYFRAGWIPADVVHALDHEPDGRQHGYTSGIGSPAHWAAYRLGLWLGPAGTPLPSRSQLVTAARERDQAEQARRRAERRAPSGYAEGAAAARAMLTARLAELPGRRRPRDPESVPPESVSREGRATGGVPPRWSRLGLRPGPARPRRTPG